MGSIRNVLAGVILALALAAFAAAAYCSGLFIWSTWIGTSTQTSSLPGFKIIATVLAALFPFLCLGILVSISEWVRED